MISALLLPMAGYNLGMGQVLARVKLTRRLAFSLPLAMMLMFPAITLAQKPATVAKPEGTSFLPWLISLGILVVVGATAFLNPKRSHLA